MYVGATLHLQISSFFTSSYKINYPEQTYFYTRLHMLSRTINILTTYEYNYANI